jgi:hypothetical protein
MTGNFKAFFAKSGFSQRRLSGAWLGKAAAGSLLGGYALSTYVLTDERLAPLASATASVLKSCQEAGLLPQGHAFSTADHGLHPAHYPWDFHKFWVSYDHAA